MTQRHLPRWLERAIPAVCGVAAAGAYYALTTPLGSTWPKQPEQVLSTAATVAAMSVGFLASVKAVLFSMAGSRIIKHLKEVDLLDLFLSYLREALWAGTALASTSIFVLFMPIPPAPTAPDGRVPTAWAVGAVLFVGAVGWTVAAYARSVLNFGALLRFHLKHPSFDE